MRKTALLLLFLLLCSFVLTSCGGNSGEETTKKKVAISQTPKETEAPEGSEGSKQQEDAIFAASYKVEKFEKPTDLRQTVVDAMRKMADMEWVCTVEHTVKNKFDTWSIDYTFKKGQVYHGIPYANLGTNYDEFARLIVDGKWGYDGPEGWTEGIPGNQCTSSINQAVKTCCNVSIKETPGMIPGHSVFQSQKFSQVGDYETTKDNTTTDIVKKNGPDKMYECYAKMQKGDIIITSDITSHTRLVADVVVERNPAGRINFNKSYVVTIEQTNTLESMKDPKFIAEHGYDSTWWVDHHYTFSTLFDTAFVPFTLKAYDDEIIEPYIALNTEIKPETLAKGTISGTVSSNLIIHHVLYQLLDKDGNVVSEVFSRTAQENKDAHVANNKYSSEELFKNAVHGTNYKFRMTVGIGPGEKVMSEVDFTFN